MFEASTRRAILGVLARIPAFAIAPAAAMALPALPALADAAALPVAEDPIYAAMEVHWDAVEAWRAIGERFREARESYLETRESERMPEIWELEKASSAAFDVMISTEKALLDMAPQSIESLRALLEHLCETGAQPLKRTLLRSPIFAV